MPSGSIRSRSDGLFCMHIDALPAYYAWNMNYPGFQGMHLAPTLPEVLINEPGGQHGRENQQRANAGGRDIHFPDGNATITRLLVRSLIPDVASGHTQEDIVTARFNYAQLDQPSHATRIRLNSLAVHVAHAGDPATSKEVVVTYVRRGKTMKVRGANVVLACWNFMIPYICPEMPEKQREALVLRDQGADRLHERSDQELDIVRETRRVEHYRARRLPHGRAASRAGQHRRL